MLTLQNLDGVILPALSTGINVHPALFTGIVVQFGTIQRKHCFIPVLFTENTIHSNIIIENTDTIHNFLTIHTSTIHFRTGVNFFLFSKFLPMKVNSGGPRQMLNIEWDTTMQLNNVMSLETLKTRQNLILNANIWIVHNDDFQKIVHARITG